MNYSLPWLLKDDNDPKHWSHLCSAWKKCVLLHMCWFFLLRPLSLQRFGQISVTTFRLKFSTFTSRYITGPRPTSRKMGNEISQNNFVFPTSSHRILRYQHTLILGINNINYITLLTWQQVVKLIVFYISPSYACTAASK